MLGQMIMYSILFVLASSTLIFLHFGDVYLYIYCTDGWLALQCLLLYICMLDLSIYMMYDYKWWFGCIYVGWMYMTNGWWMDIEILRININWGVDEFISQLLT